MADGELVEDFEEIERASERLQARRLALLAHIDRRRTWAADGHLSTASWIVDRFGASWSVATERVRTARALENMPRRRRHSMRGDLLVLGADPGWGQCYPPRGVRA
jgi:predicted 3-demethylubiquinone-9 3-methyltransferase (glyoxalase superfamily)